MINSLVFHFLLCYNHSILGQNECFATISSIKMSLNKKLHKHHYISNTIRFFFSFFGCTAQHVAPALEGGSWPLRRGGSPYYTILLSLLAGSMPVPFLVCGIFTATGLFLCCFLPVMHLPPA